MTKWLKCWTVLYTLKFEKKGCYLTLQCFVEWIKSLVQDTLVKIG